MFFTMVYGTYNEVVDVGDKWLVTERIFQMIPLDSLDVYLMFDGDGL